MWRKHLPPSLQFLQSVKVVMDPRDKAAHGLKEFMRQVTGKKYFRTNPKCVVSHELVYDYSPALVYLEYENGFKYKFLAHKMQADHVFYNMQAFTAHLREVTGMGDAEEMEEEEPEW